jgi:toxin ParE1/3/4
MLARIEEQFRLIAKQPGIGRQRDELRPGVRSVPIEAYVIYYRVTKGVVRVLRVWGGRQNPKRLAFEP